MTFWNSIGLSHHFVKGRKFYLLTILLLLGQISSAQQGLKIQGRIIDSVRIGIGNAAIVLTSGVYKIQTETDARGFFRFINYGHFTGQLYISMHGYKPIKRDFYFDSTASFFDFGEIVLNVKYDTLKGVAITAPKKSILIKGDTIEYNAASFNTPEGAELAELMRRLPGVEMDLDGKIAINGKTISQFYVDGRLFFGKDGLMLALQNLPTDIISKVQVISDYGGQARLLGIKTGEPQNTMNIILREDRKNGQFGNAEIGVGSDNKYENSLDDHLMQGERQIALNANINNTGQATAIQDWNITPVPGRNEFWNMNGYYADKWHGDLSPTGNFRISHDTRTSENSVFNQTQLANGFNSSSINSVSTNSGIKQIGSARIDLHSSASRYTQEISYSDDNTQNGITSNFNSVQSDSGFMKTTSGTNFQDSKGHTFNVSTILHYDHGISASKRKFTVGANISYAANSGTNNLLNNAITVMDSLSSNLVQRYLQQTSSTSFNVSANISYYEPTGRQSFIEVGYDFAQSVGQQNTHTDTLNGSRNILETLDSLTSRISSVSINQRIHAGWIAAIKSLSINVNLAALPLYLSNNFAGGKSGGINYSALNWTPVFQASYHLGNRETITLGYTGMHTAPSISELMPAPNISNPQYPVIGNPGLKPSLIHGLQLFYSMHSTMKADVAKSLNPYYISGGINVSETNNMVITNLVHPHDTSPVIQQTEYLNANGLYTAGLQLAAGLPKLLKRHLGIGVSSTLNIGHSVAMIDSMPYPLENMSWAQHFNIDYSKMEIYSISATGGYGQQIIKYPSGNAVPGKSSTATIAFSASWWLLKKWKFNAIFRQIFVSGINQSLQSYPATFNVYVEREFLKRNNGRIILSASNLLHSKASIQQSGTANSVSQVQTNTLGRFIMISFQYKFSKFGSISKK